MKRLLPFLCISAVWLTGCSHYAQIEQARIGMTVDELRRIDTPCYYSGQTDDKITYNCSFSVPTGPYSNKRSIKPYVMVFENGKLAEIKLNEKALDREALRDDLNFQYRFYYPYYDYYHYPWGYPYWYP